MSKLIYGVCLNYDELCSFLEKHVDFDYVIPRYYRENEIDDNDRIDISTKEWYYKREFIEYIVDEWNKDKRNNLKINIDEDKYHDYKLNNSYIGWESQCDLKYGLEEGELPTNGRNIIKKLLEQKFPEKTIKYYSPVNRSR